jgi:membrane fusion protein (multidrug efflux system)
VSLAGGACRKAPPPAPPPPEVAVVTIAPRTVDQVYEFVGNVTASRSVNVRAQVEGVILERPFSEGRFVRAGAVLYRIDPRTYDAEYRGAQARLAEAEARLANAEQNLSRLRPLMADNAIARQDLDNAETEAKSAQAAVEDARAAVDRARKNLDDTVVRAEISGRVGKAMLEVGARVRGPDDVLTSIDVLDPVYVTFQPSAEQRLAWQRDPQARRELVPGGPIRVQAVLPDGSIAPTTGRIGFIDPVVDPATGTQQFRAVFPNPRQLLLPGQFVRARLLGLSRDSAIVVPQRAVLQQMGRQVVYVVGAGDTVRVRDVAASVWSGDQWVIDSGLAAGDRVIVDGVQKTGPGRVVRPVPLADTAAVASAGASRP